MNKIQICNLALSRIGARRIQSLTTQSKEAIECNLLYEFALKSTLEAYDWGFARKRVVLAELSEDYTNWDYAYQWPIDCLAPRYIIDEDGSYTGTSYDIDRDRDVKVGKVEFVHASNSTLSGRVILTNKEDAELVYTAYTEVANLYSPMFIEALAYKLASELAQPLRGKLEWQQTMLNNFQSIIEMAKASNANQEEKKPQAENSLLDSRD